MKALMVAAVVVAAAAGLWMSQRATEGRGSFMNAFNTRYGTTGTRLDTCGVCHLDFDGGGTLNPYGEAFLDSGGNFAAIEGLYSDGDASTNLQEINLRFLPGLDCSNRAQATNAPANLADFVDPANVGCGAATPTPTPSPTATPTPTPQPDGDGDGVPDATDNCPTWPNPTQSMPAWPVPAGDPDCDGFASANEGVIGTDPSDACANTAGANDEADDRWPADFDDSRTVNVLDVVNVLPPYFGSTVGGGDPYSARRDLVPDGVINIADVVKMLPPTFGESCT